MHPTQRPRRPEITEDNVSFDCHRLYLLADNARIYVIISRHDISMSAANYARRVNEILEQWPWFLAPPLNAVTQHSFAQRIIDNGNMLLRIDSGASGIGDGGTICAELTSNRAILSRRDDLRFTGPVSMIAVLNSHGQFESQSSPTRSFSDTLGLLCRL